MYSNLIKIINKKIYKMRINKFSETVRLFKQNFNTIFDHGVGRSSKRDFLIGLVLSSFLINSLGLVLPFTIIQIYDRVIPNKSYHTFSAFIIIIFVVLLVEVILKIMRGYVSSSLDIKLGYSMNFYAYKTAVTADLIEFERVPFSVQIDRFNFINSLKEYYTGQHLITICDMPFLILYFMFFFSIQVYVGLAVTIACLVLLAISYLQAIKLKNNQLQKTKDSQIVSKFLVELLSGSNTIKTLGLEEQMLRRYERLQKTHVQKEFQFIQEKMTTSKNVNIASQIIVMVAVMISCYTIFKNYMTLGGMSACVLLAGKIMQPIASIISFIIRWEHFAIAGQEFNKLINIQQETSIIKKLNIERGEIFLKNLSFSYIDHNNNTITIFDDIQLVIPAKKVTAIHGDRLSGKSTLINILACLFKAQGEVLIDGNEIDGVNLDHLRNQIAIISEKAVLFQGTILENLTRFSNVDFKKVQQVCMEIGIHNAIQAMPNGYQTMVGVEDALTKGIRQSVCIARELIKEPKIILFDEINIDLNLEIDLILRNILNLKKGQVTMVIISARPSLLLMADQHYLIKDKKIVNYGQQ